MFGSYGMNISYLALIGISLALGLGTQAYIKYAFRRWSKVDLGTGESGARVARRMLDEAGLAGVPIQPNGGGDLSDYYDPRSNALYLSQSSEHGYSVASAAVACHEAGHAVQHARQYLPARIRTAIVPLVNIGSEAWMIVPSARHLHDRDGPHQPGHHPVRLRGGVPARDAARGVRRLAPRAGLHLRRPARGRAAGPRRAPDADGGRPHLRRPLPSPRSCSCSTCCSSAATSRDGLTWHGTSRARPET